MPDVRSVCAKIEPAWLRDPRFLVLSAEARWLYVCLWVWAVENRASVLPVRYTPDTMAIMSGLTISAVQQHLRTMATYGLIGSTSPTGNGQLVIVGVRDKHKNILRWKEEEPDSYHNPWVDANYQWHPAIAITAKTPKKKPEQKEYIDPLEKYKTLRDEFSRLRMLIQEAHATRSIKLSSPGTAQYHAERLCLARLVYIDKYDEQTIIDVITWVLTDDTSKHADFWRSNLYSLRNLRKVGSSGAIKFELMRRDWKKAHPHKLTPAQRDALLRAEGLA